MQDLLNSSKCFLTEQCWKYNNTEIDCLGTPHFCPKLHKLNFLYDEANLTENQRRHLNLRIDADGTDKDKFTILKSVQENILNFVNTGCNLYIYSTITGNGKSSWAIRLMQTYFNNSKIWATSDYVCRGLFINVPRFLLALKDNISTKSDYVQHIKENVATCDLVIWDEIGFKANTTFEMENLLNIINMRIEDGKSNIYTTNVTPDELKQNMGDRLHSRIINCSTVIQLNGRDKRNIQFFGEDTQ